MQNKIKPAQWFPCIHSFIHWAADSCWLKQQLLHFIQLDSLWIYSVCFLCILVFVWTFSLFLCFGWNVFTRKANGLGRSKTAVLNWRVGVQKWIAGRLWVERGSTMSKRKKGIRKGIVKRFYFEKRFPTAECKWDEDGASYDPEYINLWFYLQWR